MISYIQGKVARLEPTYVILECQGIGYHIHISLNTHHLLQNKETIKLHTHFQVREDAHVLYGFGNEREKKLFELLLSVSGVGGSTAMMILSGIGIEELQMAIKQEDIHTLKRIKGIGAKTAGRIVLELKDKIKMEEAGQSAETLSLNEGGTVIVKKKEAIAALVSLGLAKGGMEKRVNQIIREHGEDISVEEIIKMALRNP